MAYRNHLSNGGYTTTHKEYAVASVLNSLDFESFLAYVDNLEYEVVYIPPGFEHRADLISNLFYDTPTLDWIVCWVNNVHDPFQQLNIGDRLIIPKLS